MSADLEPMLIFESLYAEIQRLKAVVESQNRSIDRHLTLINELCDALEFYAPFSLEPHYRALITRAREATR